MAAEVLGSEIKCLSESLEINADAHKETEGKNFCRTCCVVLICFVLLVDR